MIFKFKTYFFLPILFFLLIVSACKKDKLLTDSSSKIEFSTDTVLFDTVFRYAGSTTKQFKIYNPHKQSILVSSIHLAGGKASAFRINVDGISNYHFNDIEVPANDSVFIFVQVTVNPSQSAPLLIKDSVVFETNGNIQNVKLTAIGQDVYLHKPDHFPSNGLPPYSITGREGVDTVLPNDKPHLFFGYTVIDSDCKLTLKAGTRLYFHNRAVLWVYESTLIVEGTYKNEVVFQGDRLEADYKEAPGQWGKIWFSKGSRNNVINWAIIKNGMIGIQADSVATVGAPTVKLSNTIIRNMTSAAVYGQGARIWANNCVFANCGECVAYLSIGGIYKFEHCTFANFWKESARTTPLLGLNNYYISANNTYVIRNLDSAYFGNCILYGDLEEEVGLDSSIYGGKFSYKFENCILKTARAVSNPSYYKNIYKNGDPAFKEYEEQNYHLNSSSAAIDKGYNTMITTDLENKARPNPSTSLPDLGAYEFYP
jgi:hypothetical protein